jgi:hypothetical protein
MYKTVKASRKVRSISKSDKFVCFLNGQLSWTVVYMKENISFVYIKWSRLADHLKTGPEIEWLKQDGDFSKTGHKLCPKNGHSKTGLSRFQMVTIIRTYI